MYDKFSYDEKAARKLVLAGFASKGNSFNTFYDIVQAPSVNQNTYAMSRYLTERGKPTADEVKSAKQAEITRNLAVLKNKVESHFRSDEYLQLQNIDYQPLADDKRPWRYDFAFTGSLSMQFFDIYRNQVDADNNNLKQRLSTTDSDLNIRRHALNDEVFDCYINSCFMGKYTRLPVKSLVMVWDLSNDKEEKIFDYYTKHGEMAAKIKEIEKAGCIVYLVSTNADKKTSKSEAAFEKVLSENLQYIRVDNVDANKDAIKTLMQRVATTHYAMHHNNPAVKWAPKRVTISGKAPKDPFTLSSSPALESLKQEGSAPKNVYSDASRVKTLFNNIMSSKKIPDSVSDKQVYDDTDIIKNVFSLITNEIKKVTLTKEKVSLDIYIQSILNELNDPMRTIKLRNNSFDVIKLLEAYLRAIQQRLNNYHENQKIKSAPLTNQHTELTKAFEFSYALIEPIKEGFSDEYRNSKLSTQMKFNK